MKSRNLVWVFIFSLCTAFVINAVELSKVNTEIPDSHRASIEKVEDQLKLDSEI